MTDEHDQAMFKLAKWIKAHHQRYAPITAVSKIPGYRSILKDLKKWGLVSDYKCGDVWFLTEFGWACIAEKHPDIMRRR